MRKRKWVPTAVAVLALIAGLAGAGCTSSASTANAGSSNTVFTMTTEASGPFPDSFNPFVTSTYSGYIEHLIYEPLEQINYAKLQIEPWLATGYTWSDGGRTMTLKIRPGVTWSNGKPFTASDVAFTFQLMKKFPAANIDALPIASASAPSATQAVIHFTESSYSQLYNIVGTLIVPEAQWSKVSNPATYENSHPIGTGPYVLKTFTPQVVTVTKNTHYWQHGLPVIGEVQAVQEDTTASTEAALETGTVDWSAEVFQDHATITSQHPNLTMEAYPFVDVPIVPNFAKYPLNLLPVRQAISEALNRPAIVQLLAGYADTPMNNQTGLVAQSMGDQISPQYKNATFTYSTSQAKQTLEKAGFKLGSDGIFTAPNGTPLQLQFLIPSTYSNWVAISPVIQSELKAAGIGLSIQLTAETTWAADTALGQFDLTMNSEQYENPYSFYNFYFGQTGTAPLGKTATTDYGRYSNATTENLLSQLNGAEPGSAAYNNAVAQLETVMVQQEPVIPLFVNSQMGIFNTSQVTGFPTSSNLYAFPSEINTELIVLHLRPAK